HTSSYGDWSSDVCSSDLTFPLGDTLERTDSTPRTISDRARACARARSEIVRGVLSVRSSVSPRGKVGRGGEVLRQSGRGEAGRQIGRAEWREGLGVEMEE